MPSSSAATFRHLSQQLLSLHLFWRITVVQIAVLSRTSALFPTFCVFEKISRKLLLLNFKLMACSSDCSVTTSRSFSLGFFSCASQSSTHCSAALTRSLPPSLHHFFWLVRWPPCRLCFCWGSFPLGSFFPATVTLRLLCPLGSSGFLLVPLWLCKTTTRRHWIWFSSFKIKANWSWRPLLNPSHWPPPPPSSFILCFSLHHHGFHSSELCRTLLLISFPGPQVHSTLDQCSSTTVRALCVSDLFV